jgi:hypothetical protein
MSRIPERSRVVKKGFGYIGTLLRYERKYGQEWAVVQWAGRPHTALTNPRELEPATESA